MAKSKPDPQPELWATRVVEVALRSPMVRELIAEEVRRLIGERIAAEVNAAVRSHLRRRATRAMVAEVVASVLEGRRAD